MIEVPSAVFTSDNLAREADFFSIGSNDLIQYALAADRGNERVADLYDALDPAVVRAIAATVRGAQEAGIPVSSCGEMSGELPGLLLLAGLGVTELSVAPLTVTRVKEMLRRVRLADLEMIARECLCARDRREVWDAIRAGLRPYEEFQFEKRDGRWLCRWQPPAAEGAR
jgi:phosphotransferase system enzyme I (PtsI)